MQRWLRRWWPALLLGVGTIGAYGTAYYSLGVLIPAITDDTGWSTGALSGGFSLAMLSQGGVALLCGRILDRRGSRAVLLPALGIGSALLLAASYAETAGQFVLAWAAGGAVIGGGLYYNVTMPMTARLFAGNRVAAFSILTLLGALSSPIFYPLAAWLIEELGWRSALRVLVAVSAACVAPAALLVRAPVARPAADPASRGGLMAALRQGPVRQALLVFALAAFANSALLLHQVSVMQAAGLSLAVASGFAGARGFCQIPGRLLLSPLTNRFGVRGTLALCYGLAATAGLALMLSLGGSMTLLLAGYFALVGGASMGLLSPLNGLFQAEVYGDERLGMLSGVNVVVVSTAGAAGAWLAGLAVDVTGTYTLPLAIAAVIQTAAIVQLRRHFSASPRVGNDAVIARLAK